MILADTSVWVDHFRRGDTTLAALLEQARVLGHPMVMGEIALGNLRSRNKVIGSLANLPQAVVASDGEVMVLIERHRLFGAGLGHVDAHLVASTLLTPGARLWTRDLRLAEAAARVTSVFVA